MLNVVEARHFTCNVNSAFNSCFEMPAVRRFAPRLAAGLAFEEGRAKNRKLPESTAMKNLQGGVHVAPCAGCGTIHFTILELS